jgi:hypothetical protein
MRTLHETKRARAQSALAARALAIFAACALAPRALAQSVDAPSSATPAAASAPASASVPGEASGAAEAAQAQTEPVRHVDLLDNGDFELRARPGLPGLPHWKLIGRADPGARIEGEAGAAELVLSAGVRAVQPIAVHAPLIGALRVRARVAGRGLLQLVDGGGQTLDLPLASEGEGARDFELGAAELGAWLARAQPRLALAIGVDPAAGPQAQARWSGLAVLVALPCPDEAALRAELELELDALWGAWAAGALDRAGPRATAFLATEYDAVTGAALRAFERSATLDAFPVQLLEAERAGSRPAWRAQLERYLADLFELGLHPATGLPRQWDAQRDAPVDDGFVEIHRHLRFLLDLHAHGPQAWRARALAAAKAMGECVLARGLLPDGSVAAAYRSSDGAPSSSTVPIRRLDVPAQLVRLGRACGDERYLAAAREAVIALEYAHHWPGSWDRIDPGFDDIFGHYGERASAMWAAAPDEPSFRHFALSGWKTYAPLWRAALEHGGNVAADQVRCWRIAAELARLEPALEPAAQPLLASALRVHFKGEQAPGGAWIDVTIKGFDPISTLPVGDTGGVPQNLLEGLAALHDEELGLRGPDTRAMYTAVMRSTRTAYRAPHGSIGGARFARGAGARNSASGTLRVTGGLVEMWVRLAP